jgi:type I restriction enzyme R subunit
MHEFPFATLDEYISTPDDTLVAGEIEIGKRYEEKDFNKIIEIMEEAYCVRLFMEQIDQQEKTIMFCATHAHSLAMRDLVNQLKTSSDQNYCQRVAANDGALGEQHLCDFQDNEKTIPTILTTSQKSSTVRGRPPHPQYRPNAPDQLDHRVQADHRTRYPTLRREGLFHHL